VKTTWSLITSREPLSLKTVLFIGVVLAISLSAQAPDPSSFSLAPGDITEAIVDTSTPARLKVLLTPKKTAELTAFTGLNLNKQASIVVAGKLRSQPLIRERMTGPSMDLYVNSAEDALATVKALLTANLKFEQLHTWTDNRGQTHYSEKPPVRSPSDQPPPAGQVSDARTKGRLQELQGSWQVIKATMNGKEKADRSLLGGHWTFLGNELTLASPKKGTARFTLQLDSKANAFHLTSIEPPNAGSGWMLFSREGATLKIAFNDNLEGRPAGFEPREPGAKPELVVVTLAPNK
jgi:uncharacterized protein (TIGR03067 family)